MVIVFFIWLFCAEACALLASFDGDRSWKWFFLGLILGPIALIYLLLNRKRKK